MFMLNWWEIVCLCNLNWMVQSLRSGRDYVKDRSWIHGPRLYLKYWWSSTITNKSSVKKRPIMISGRCYRICLMVIKHTILVTIRGSMLDKVSAKSFLAKVANRFIKLDKVKASTHLSKLINMCYNSKENIKEYIRKMSNLVSN